MDEQELKKHLTALVQQFCTKRNEYESFVMKQSDAAKAARPKFANDEEKFAWLRENPPINWFNEFSKLLSPLFDEYCTDKKRVYVGSNSFGFPVKFNGIDTPVETSVELKNKNRAEIYFKTETKFRDEYLFVLLRKTEQWKIDSYKSRRYGNEKWDNKIL